MPTHTTNQLEIHVTDPARLHDLLTDAEHTLRQTPQHHAGILVTRHTPHRYTLTLCDTVPFGETHEQTLP